MDRLVCFAHGKESGPWGIKITYLAEIARKRSFEVMSPDYSRTFDPHQRVAMLQQLAPRADSLVLVGSSMGAYVSAMACQSIQPDALFLMAPALYFPGWDEEPEGIPRNCSVIHGLQDEVVPHERASRFAQRNGAELHLIQADHSLNDHLLLLGQLLERMLDRVVDGSATV